MGEVCYKDNECESGFVCVEYSGMRSCQTPVPGEKIFGKKQIDLFKKSLRLKFKLFFAGEDCSTSSDCNIQKGLCCKLHRGAKSKPKKAIKIATSTKILMTPEFF